MYLELVFYVQPFVLCRAYITHFVAYLEPSNDRSCIFDVTGAIYHN